MNRTYKIGYNVDGQRRYERISAPSMQAAETAWKHYRRDLDYTGFTIYNPDHSA